MWTRNNFFIAFIFPQIVIASRWIRFVEMLAQCALDSLRRRSATESESSPKRLKTLGLGVALSFDDDRFSELVRRSSGKKKVKARSSRSDRRKLRASASPSTTEQQPRRKAMPLRVVFSVSGSVADNDRRQLGEAQLVALGASPAAASFSEKETTHLVCCGPPRKTFTTLAAIAAGCHVVDCSWLRASSFAGVFLSEKPHALAARSRTPLFAQNAAVGIFSSKRDGERGLGAEAMSTALRLVAIGGGAAPAPAFDVSTRAFKARLRALVATCSSSSTSAARQWLIIVPDATPERARSRVVETARTVLDSIPSGGSARVVRVQCVFDRIAVAKVWRRDEHRGGRTSRQPHDVDLGGG